MQVLSSSLIVIKTLEVIHSSHIDALNFDFSLGGLQIRMELINHPQIAKEAINTFVGGKIIVGADQVFEGLDLECHFNEG